MWGRYEFGNIAVAGDYLVTYTGSQHLGGMTAFAIDRTTGALTAVPLADTTSTCAVAGRIVADPARNILYASGVQYSGTAATAACPAFGAVEAYRLNVDGTLSQLGTPVLVQQAGAVAADPLGRFLFVQTENQIAVMQLNPDGSVGSMAAGSPVAIPGPTAPAAPTPPWDPCMQLSGSLTTSPSGNFLYAVCNGRSAINVFSIGANGQLNVVQTLTSTGNAEFTSIALSPAGTLAIATQLLAGSVTMFAVDPDSGKLTQSTSATAGTGPNAAAWDDTGMRVYVSNGTQWSTVAPGSNNVSGFFVSANGTMTSTPGSAYTAGQDPTSIVFVRP